MGADLVGYMVVGKNSITEEMRQAAVAKAKATRDIAKAWDAAEEAKEDFKPPYFPETWEALCFDTAEYVDHIAEMTDEDCETAVNTAIGFLNDPAYRDCASRSLGNDEFVLFCGEMTWGDEPEGGGYSELKTIHELDIVAELGLR
jgi:hypothetical protein